MELFKKLNGEGTTIVQVTHSEANAAYGDRVIQLADGWVVSGGSVPVFAPAPLRYNGPTSCSYSKPGSTSLSISNSSRRWWPVLRGRPGSKPRLRIRRAPSISI
jgi:energy-coupling factor transporter ATP-binding protein EcfA2